MQEWNLQHEAVRALLAFLGSFLALAGVLILEPLAKSPDPQVIARILFSGGHCDR
jgi:hypothetical protein